MKYKISDYEKRCIECQHPLLNAGGLYFHPDVECSVMDGIRMIQKTEEYIKFKEEYGLPEESEHEIKERLIKEMNKLINELNLLKARRWYQWLWLDVKVKAKSLKGMFVKSI